MRCHSVCRPKAPLAANILRLYAPNSHHPLPSFSFPISDSNSSLHRIRATKSPVAPSCTARHTSCSPANPSSSMTSSSAATSFASNNHNRRRQLPPQLQQLQQPTRKTNPPTPSPSTSAATSLSPHTARCTHPPASPPHIPAIPLPAPALSPPPRHNRP